MSEAQLLQLQGDVDRTYIEFLKAKNTFLEATLSHLQTNVPPVGPDVDVESDEEREDPGPQVISNGIRKTGDKLENGGANGSDKSIANAANADISEQKTSPKASNETGESESCDEKPGRREVDKDKPHDSPNVSTEDKTRRIRTVINRVRVLINYLCSKLTLCQWNDSKTKWEDIEDEFEKTKDNQEKAATFRRHMDVDNEKKVDFEEIEIYSSELKNLMAETDEWWRDVVGEDTQDVTVESPFYHFVWNWDHYVKACETKDTDTSRQKTARKDLKDLMQLIKTSSCNGLESYFRTRELIRTSKKIKFDFLWTLFGHGARVYARSYMDEHQMFEVSSCSEPPYKGKRFRVTCSAFDWDGTKFSTYSYDFYIKEFGGEKFINSLEVFPTEFFCDKDGKYDDSQLQQHLSERGKKYCDLCTGEPTTFQCEYQGTALVMPSGLHRLASKGRVEDALLSYSDPRWTQYDGGQEVDVTSIDIVGKHSRVIVDNYAFLKSERNTMKRGDMPPLGKKVPYFDLDCVCEICKSSPLQQWRPETILDRSLHGLGKAFSEDEIRLRYLPPRLLGFALKDKMWGQFLVDELTRVPDRQEQMEPFWDELQLENESKELLMAFVKHHQAPSLQKFGPGAGGSDDKVLDIIEGKGKGLAILLHGPSGVGKTLTAEAIALATGRPLLTVSVAEIGVAAHEAERKLTDVFVDAARWEAVLLMDEADVFVEERLKGDLGRNALVSVLLRCLEYYDGEYSLPRCK